MSAYNFSRNYQEIWIGLAEVVPILPNTELDGPAYVNVVGLAFDEESFVELVQCECENLGITLVSLEDVELWKNRIQSSEPNREVIALAESVSVTQPMLFDTFFRFDE